MRHAADFMFFLQLTTQTESEQVFSGSQYAPLWEMAKTKLIDGPRAPRELDPARCHRVVDDFLETKVWYDEYGSGAEIETIQVQSYVL